MVVDLLVPRRPDCAQTKFAEMREMHRASKNLSRRESGMIGMDSITRGEIARTVSVRERIQRQYGER